MRFFPISFFLVLFFLVPDAVARDFQTELNGFRLRQYREATHNEFGEPDRGGAMGDDIAYEAFFLSEEPLLYMVFQYREPYDGLIWSIQMTGEDTKAEIGFKGLRFGMTEAEVAKILGNASKKIDVGEHGTRWEFDEANYSVEINTNKRLSSIRIVDDPKYLSQPDIEKIPPFKELLKTITTGTNAEMANLLAPDMELYVDGKISYFGRRMKSEIASDYSKIFSTIRELSKLLQRIDVEKEDEFEENLRLRLGTDPLHVYKFKKIPRVKEIVLKWDGSAWKLWEFDAGKPLKDDQASSGYEPRKLNEIVTDAGAELEKRPNVVLYAPDKTPKFALSYDPFRSAVSVTFSGETRATSPLRTELMEFSLQSFGRPKETAREFDTEIGVIEEGKTYWLAFSKEKSEDFRRSVKKGDRVVLYITWIGIAYHEKEREFVFLTHGFELDALASDLTENSGGPHMSGHDAR